MEDSNINDPLFFPNRIRVYANRIVGGRIAFADNAHWQWCCKTLEIGTWKKMIGFMGESATYCFHNAEDLVAFKLVHGL